MLQFGKSWLEKELQKYYEGSNPPGLSSDEFAETVVTMLNSGRSNDELQNEVSRFRPNSVVWVLYHCHSFTLLAIGLIPIVCCV
jgi:hypothetical protein